MSFKSKGPKSQPSQSPKANPTPPKPTPEKDSKSTNQKSTQKPNQKINQNSKLQPGKNQPRKNQRPKTNSSEETKNNINPPPLDLNKDAKNIITNLTSQPFKEPSTSPTTSPLEPNKEAKNRITRPVFKPNMFQNGKNKITRINFKPNQNKRSKNIISRLIFDPNKPTPNKNKIGRPKLALNDETKNKIIRHKLELNSKSKNRITRIKINPDNKQKSNNKIRRNSFKPNIETKSQIINDETKRPMVKVDRELKININGKYEKNQKNSPKLDGSNYSYKNLSDREIQNAFKKYYDEIGKFPNYGRNLRKDFIDWVKNSEKNPEVISKIKDIQNNQEIRNFIKDKIQNSNLSQQEISELFIDKKLYVSRRTIGNISLKEVYDDNKIAHHKRFDLSLAPEIKENILNRLEIEIEKNNTGIKHDSLYKIAKDFPEVSKTMIDKLAKKKISQDLYKNMWPSTGTVDPENKRIIRTVLEKEAQEGKPRSLRNISEDFPDVSKATISVLAKEMYPEKYKEFWPAIEKIHEETKIKILTTIKEEAQKENPRTLREIHRDYPDVGSDSIKRFAKQAIPKELHDKIWPSLTTEIPKKLVSKITQTLKDEINQPKPRPFKDLGRLFNVSIEYIRQLAKRTISKQVYEDIWKAHEPITNLIKNNIIKDIMNTRLNISEIAEKNEVSSPSVSKISQREVFQDKIDAHRVRFPIDENLEIGTFTHLNLNSLLTEIINKIPNQKYYTEPNIHSDKRRPDGLILEDNNFIHQRLTHPQTGQYLSAKSELDPKNLDHIKSTQFDFTNDISYENLINKIEKYQSKDTLLVIVGTRWYLYDDIKHLPVDDRIKYPENVRVVSHNLGAILIGVEGRDKELYDKIVDFNNNHDLESLKTLYNFDLSSINTHNTEELKKDLIQKGLIKEKFSEYFNYDEINKKDPKEKQLDLDYFLNC